MKPTTNHLLILLVFFVASLVGIWHHEIWLDESHHWLLARDSESIGAFLQNTRFEGHPILWNILLYIITRFTTDPFWMQFAHILIASGAIWVFLRKSPFSLWFKLLFVFGYFMFYEYNIISRNYMLGVLFLFLACSSWLNKKNLVQVATFLALAANTHLMFWVISVAFVSMIVLNHRNMYKSSNQKAWIPATIYVFGLVLAAVQILPPEGASHYGHLNFNFTADRFVPGFVSFFKGLAPIPDFRSIHYWNSNLLLNLSKPISGVLSVLVYALPLLLFRKKRFVLLFAYLGLIGTQFFFFFTQLSATRYFGMTFVIFILALWLYHGNASEETPKASSRFGNFLIYGILITQCIAGLIAYTMDLQHSFSSGKQVAGFLEENNLQDRTVVTPDCIGTVLSSDLRKKVYFLCGESMQSYCDWNASCAQEITDTQIIEGLSRSSLEGAYVFVGKSDLIESKEPLLWNKVNDRLRVRWLGQIEPQVLRRTDYSIYEIYLGDE